MSCISLKEHGVRNIVEHGVHSHGPSGPLVAAGLSSSCGLPESSWHIPEKCDTFSLVGIFCLNS
jgi:hypothetical protein